MFELLVTALCVVLRAASVLAAEEHGPSGPQQVHFHSKNLRNTVLWTPGDDATQGITYTVEYAIYGDSVEVGGTEQVAWRPVKKCQEITNTECDVTEQTADMEEEYFARVRANRRQTHSAWVETGRRFRPMMDTILGPPDIEVAIKDKFMTINLKGPFRWKSGQKGRSLMRIFPSTVYNITVYHKTEGTDENIWLENESLLLGPLEYKSEHCVMAEALSRSLPLKSMPSNWTCITMPDDWFLSYIHMVILGVIVPTALCLFILVALGGFAYYYIYDHKQKLPKSTVMVHNDENRHTFKPENPLTIINVNLMNISNMNTEESKLSPLNTIRPIMPPPAPAVMPELPRTAPSYATQGVHHVSSSPEGPQDDSLSDDYGFIQQEEKFTTFETKQYMAQNNDQGAEDVERYDDKDEEEEEELTMQTFLNWDPETRVLKIPLLSQFSEDTTEAETETGTEPPAYTSLLQRRPVLTSVVVRQSSEEPIEENTEEDVFSKMEKDWGLQIQSIQSS